MDKSQASSAPRVLVIGGMNLDILGTADSPFQAGDSLPGRIITSPGGVARNIAALLRSLGARVELICPLGDDQAAQQLEDSCRHLGIGLSHAIRIKGPSPTYLAIHDQQGDMVCAINDMGAMAAMTPQRLQDQMKDLPTFDACVLDANLSSDTLVFLAEKLSCPLVADPVSAVKCHRLLPILGRLHAIKPNLMEAKALTGMDSCEDAARALLEAGVRQVYISLGKDGVYFTDGNQGAYLKAPHLPQVRLTGAGDAMTAGLTLGIAKQLPLLEAAKLGMDAATRYLENLIDQSTGKV